MLKTSAPSKAAIPLVDVDDDGIEVDSVTRLHTNSARSGIKQIRLLKVVDVVPGKPGMAKFNQFAGRGLPGSQVGFHC